MTETEKAVGRFLIVTAIVVPLIAILGGVVWQELNRARTPVVVCGVVNHCIVQLGTILNPGRYEYVQGVEYVYGGDGPYRIEETEMFEKPLVMKLTPHRTWQTIDELPPDAHRWYVTGRIARDEFQKKADATR